MKRISTALVLGMTGAVLIWTLTPLNNYVLNGSFIADSFLPESAVALILVLTLVVNPLLRRFCPGWALDRRQLRIIFAVMLVAVAMCAVLRVFPHSLARGNVAMAQDKVLADIHAGMHLPAALYIDPVAFGDATPVCDRFTDRLEEGAAIPWRHWLPPLLSWGTMIMACCLCMSGLALVLYPHWRLNERLPFPLLTVQRALVDVPVAGSAIPTLFRNRLFWTACLTVLVLHSFNGLNLHTHDSFPRFPLSWNLAGAFTEGAWRHIEWYAKSGSIYFTLVGITYFMPNRIGLSLWGTFVVAQIFRAIGTQYFPPFDYGSRIVSYRFGAGLAIAAIVLWLSRSQWRCVARAMFRGGATPEARRDRVAGWMLASGMLLLFAWLVWAGMSWQWALASVAVAQVAYVVIARVVAETGMPFAAVYSFDPVHLMTLLPARLTGVTDVYLGGFVRIMTTEATSRNSAAVMCMHGLALNDEEGPRGTSRLSILFVAVLLVGLVVCGAAHVRMGYNYSESVDGVQTPVSSWGSRRIDVIHNEIRDWPRGHLRAPVADRWRDTAVGVMLGGGLMLGCMASPAWVLHPIGLLLVGGWFLGLGWFSIFLGWLLKTLIVRFGGSVAYRGAQPLFLGLIMGEVFAAILWALVPVILIACGADPHATGHILVVPQ